MKNININQCGKATILLILCTALLLLPSCGSAGINTMDSVIAESDSSSFLFSVGATQFYGSPESYQVCESGIIYLSGGYAQYYDFDLEENYILCSKPNCRHNSKDCIAYAGSGEDEALVGLCYLDRLFYALRRNEESARYELIQIDLASDTVAVIGSIDIGSYETDAYVINSIGAVYYAGDYVWFSINYDHVIASGEIAYEDETIVLAGMRLSTGDIVYLTTPEDDMYSVSFGAISDQYVVYVTRQYEETLLDSNAFQTQLESGAYSEYADDEDPYYMYQSEFERTVPVQYKLIIYDTSTSDQTEFKSAICEKVLDEDGDVLGNFDPYCIDGITNELLLYENFSYKKKELPYTLYGYSFAEQTEETIYSVENGGGVITNTTADLSSVVIGENLVLLCQPVETDQVQLFYYDIKSDTRTDLFVDSSRITFRLVGSTSDSYVGIIYDDNDAAFYQIAKSEYEAGNLSAAKKLDIPVLH